jgi:hypothetical protein
MEKRPPITNPELARTRKLNQRASPEEAELSEVSFPDGFCEVARYITGPIATDFATKNLTRSNVEMPLKLTNSSNKTRVARERHENFGLGHEPHYSYPIMYALSIRKFRHIFPGMYRWIIPSIFLNNYL